jgi:hypothetical protein
MGNIKFQIKSGGKPTAWIKIVIRVVNYDGLD